MRKGIYYIPRTDNIIYLSEIQHYEDLSSEFIICTWEYFAGVFKKTIITSDQFKSFKWIGSL